MENIIKQFNKDLISKCVIILLFVISVLSFYYFYTNNQLLLYGDSLSRMNISRKIIDNLTPGLAQLGNVWLPLPQILQLFFVWNDFLWHTGISGALVSIPSFIIGGIFLYKSAKILTNSSLAAFLATLVYSFNINLWYLQVTAMSEPIYLCLLSIAIYYFIMWIKHDRNLHYLMLSAIAVSCSTLVRYEALAILLASIPMVFIYSVIKLKNYHKAEGSTLLFAFLACFGFGLWTIYLTAIFGDPLYWKNYYTASHTVGDGDTQLHVFSSHLNFVEAVIEYVTAIVWMNGLIPTFLAFLALPVLAYRSIKEKTFYFLPVLLSFSMFAFMISTLMRNTPIDQPVLNWSNIMNPEILKFPEFNIRYGLLMLPMITLLVAYLFGIKNYIVKFVILSILCVQFYTYINPSIVLIFQLPRNVEGNITQGTKKEKEMMEWMKQNYDGGLIMISALKHDPQMLQMGLKYRTYIHEGTDKYWKESQKDPQRYATWIIFDSYNKDDQVTKYLKDTLPLELYYNRVYNNDGMYIYKIKTKPDIEI